MRFPRVADFNVQSVEIYDIPRCDTEILGLRCPGDKRIAQVQYTTRSMSVRPKPGRPLRFTARNRNYTILILRDNPRQCGAHPVPAMPLWKQVQAERQFMEHNGRQPEIVLASQEGNNSWVRLSFGYL